MAKRVIRAVLLALVIFGLAGWLSWNFFIMDWSSLGWTLFILAFTGMIAIWLGALNLFIWLNKPDK